MLAFSHHIIRKFTIFFVFHFRSDSNEDTVVTDTVVAKYSINTFYHFEFQKIVTPNNE